LLLDIEDIDVSLTGADRHGLNAWCIPAGWL